MLRLAFRHSALLLLLLTFSMASAGYIGHAIPGDVFLYLNHNQEAERRASILAFDTQTGVSTPMMERADLLEFTVSPDGRFLLYSQRQRHTTAFFIHDLSTQDEYALIAGHIDTPRWSPDGQWIAFRNNQLRERGLYIIPATGGETRRITDQAHGVFGWTADSSALMYVERLESNWGIFAIPLTGGQEELIVAFDAYLTGLAGYGQPVLAIADALPQHYDFVSGEYELLSERMVFPSHPTWTPRGDRWAFVSVNAERTAWGLTLYDGNGEFIRMFQPAGLAFSSSPVWWLSR